MKPSDMNSLILATFDLEKQFKDHLKDKCKEEPCDTQIDEVIEVIKTLEVEKTNEYMVVAAKGLFFATIT
jgi:hypothetical protein